MDSYLVVYNFKKLVRHLEHHLGSAILQNVRKGVMGQTISMLIYWGEGGI